MLYVEPRVNIYLRDIQDQFFSKTKLYIVEFYFFIISSM